METIRLFDRDAYATEFRARVTEICPIEETPGDYAIVLNETLFFPEEGGQSPDTGRLAEGDVLDVQIKNGVITHRVHFDGAVPTVGDTVQGAIDWDHRYSNMQNHSGEHIFSGIVHRLFGFDNVGFHLSDHTVTMDYSGVLTEEDIHKVERLANEAIYQNIEIRCEYPDEATLAALDYRSKKELSGAVRIVTIPGVDVCACCAPHVHRTGEIGMLKVIGSQKYKGGVRLQILCGYRALEGYGETLRQLTAISQQLSASVEQIPDYIDRMKEENRRLSAALRAMHVQKMTQEMEAIPPEQKHVFLFADAIDSNLMRRTVNELMKTHGGYCGVFVCTAVDNFAYIIGSKELDCREVGTALREHFDAKGGGKPEMIQGSVSGANAEELLDFLQERYR